MSQRDFGLTSLTALLCTGEQLKRGIHRA